MGVVRQGLGRGGVLGQGDEEVGSVGSVGFGLLERGGTQGPADPGLTQGRSGPHTALGPARPLRRVLFPAPQALGLLLCVQTPGVCISGP